MLPTRSAPFLILRLSRSSTCFETNSTTFSLYSQLPFKRYFQRAEFFLSLSYTKKSRFSNLLNRLKSKEAKQANQNKQNPKKTNDFIVTNVKNRYLSGDSVN